MWSVSVLGGQLGEFGMLGFLCQPQSGLMYVVPIFSLGGYYVIV